MRVEYPGFGTVVIDGERFDRDMIIEAGRSRPRKKGPSRARRGEFGHTPLTAAEDIPWSSGRLIIGTGYSGSLPIAAGVREEAVERGVELVTLPTADACELLRSLDDDAEVAAILHVTC